MTENKLSAYSEYKIKITEVLKGAADLANTEVIAERFGATIELPNTRKVIIRDADRGTPEIGHRYVMFLKQDPGGDSYSIITAYELIDGRMRALETEERYGAFEGSQEATFLDILRTSLK